MTNQPSFKSNVVLKAQKKYSQIMWMKYLLIDILFQKKSKPSKTGCLETMKKIWHVIHHVKINKNIIL